MRPLLAISLVSLSVQPALADESNVIEWHAGHPLSWDDFQGSVPRGADAARVAATAASISWSYEYAVQWSAQGCAFEIEAIDSAALFHPDKSWARPQNRTQTVLHHEQIHFDIAQLYETQFQAATREFLGVARECDGRSERRAARSVEAAISALVGSVFDEIWREYRGRQEAYDRDTQHGIDPEAQARWQRSIAEALQAAPGR